jgi:hypothetical protein
MNVLIIALAIAASAASPVSRAPILSDAAAKAADPVALAAAEKLLAQMHVSQSIDRMLEQLVPMMSSAIIGELEHNPATEQVVQQIEAKPDGRARLTAIFTDEVLKSLRTHAPDIVKGAAGEYASVFSASELNGLLGFFASGAGAKWLLNQSQLQQSIGRIGQQVGREAGAEAGTRAMERAVKEILPSSKSSS